MAKALHRPAKGDRMTADATSERAPDNRTAPDDGIDTDAIGLDDLLTAGHVDPEIFDTINRRMEQLLDRATQQQHERWQQDDEIEYADKGLEKAVRRREY